MLLSTLYSGRTLPCLAGGRTRIGDLLRFKSSSPLSRHDLLYPSPEDSPWLSSPKSTPSTPPPLLPSKTTSTPSSSSFLPSAQRSHPRIPQPKPSLNKAPPLRSPEPSSKQTSGVRVTSSSLLALLRDLARNPASPPTPSADLVALFAGKGLLVVTCTKEEVEEMARRLMEAASSLEGGVDVANWILLVTEGGRQDKGVKDLVYATVLELQNGVLTRLSPRPHPEPVLRFLLSNQARIRLSFVRRPNPLVGLLEVYARLYTQDRRRFDPSAVAPPPDVLVELEILRLQHLAAVRAIHQAMKQVDKDVFTVRCYNSLMDAYNQGRSFQEVVDIWELMRSEGGVGINQRSVSVYLDACGFSGSLPRALATWKDLRTSGFALDENDYHAYNECLNRCGAWDELLEHLTEQQAQHLGDPSSAPSVHPGSLARLVALGRKLVMYPRHQSLRQVDWKEYDRLKARTEEVVPKEIWEEVQRLGETKGRWDTRITTKTGAGRREERAKLE